MTKSKRSEGSGISRRRALTQLGLGLSALTVGCASTGSEAPIPGDDEPPDLGGEPLDLREPPDLAEVLPGTPKELLAGIDAVVVLMKRTTKPVPARLAFMQQVSKAVVTSWERERDDARKTLASLRPGESSGGR